MSKISSGLLICCKQMNTKWVLCIVLPFDNCFQSLTDVIGVKVSLLNEFFSIVS